MSVYTWRWDGIMREVGETLVTVEFHDLGNSTEIIVTHERFPDAGTRDRHRSGWEPCLDRLTASCG
jgi:hypothetical protein